MNIKVKNLQSGISIVTINEPKTYNSLSYKNLKDLIHNNASENEITDYVFKENKSIDEASVDLIKKGVTSCEEIIRVNNIKEDASI